MEFLAGEESDSNVGGGSKPGANGAVEHAERNRLDSIERYRVYRGVRLVKKTIGRPRVNQSP